LNKDLDTFDKYAVTTNQTDKLILSVEKKEAQVFAIFGAHYLAKFVANFLIKSVANKDVSLLYRLYHYGEYKKQLIKSFDILTGIKLADNKEDCLIQLKSWAFNNNVKHIKFFDAVFAIHTKHRSAELCVEEAYDFTQAIMDNDTEKLTSLIVSCKNRITKNTI